jgi:hypothetical protein
VVIQRAREKLGAKTTEQAVLWAYRNGEFAYWREQPTPRARNRSAEEIRRDRERLEVERERRRMRRDGDFASRGLRGSSDEKAYLHPSGDPDSPAPARVYAALDDAATVVVEYDGEAEQRDEYQAALDAAASQSEEVHLLVTRAKRSGDE